MAVHSPDYCVGVTPWHPNTQESMGLDMTMNKATISRSLFTEVRTRKRSSTEMGADTENKEGGHPEKKALCSIETTAHSASTPAKSSFPTTPDHSSAPSDNGTDIGAILGAVAAKLSVLQLQASDRVE